MHIYVIVKCLQQVLTKQHQPKEREPNPLFLSYVRPYKASYFSKDCTLDEKSVGGGRGEYKRI